MKKSLQVKIPVTKEPEQFEVHLEEAPDGWDEFAISVSPGHAVFAQVWEELACGTGEVLAAARFLSFQLGSALGDGETVSYGNGVPGAAKWRFSLLQHR